MTTPTCRTITRSSLRKAIETMRSQIPAMTEGEAGFHSALALMIGAYFEILNDEASPEQKLLLIDLVNFVLEAGQQLSGADFQNLAEELRHGNN